MRSMYYSYPQGPRHKFYPLVIIGAVAVMPSVQYPLLHSFSEKKIGKTKVLPVLPVNGDPGLASSTQALSTGKSRTLSNRLTPPFTLAFYMHTTRPQ